MTGPTDIGIVSLGTTLGWRRGDAALAEQVRAAGHSCELVAAEIGWSGKLRRHPALTDVVEGLATRRAAARLDARALVYCSVTAALLQPARGRFAVRFDTLAAQSRPGPGGAWQRRREPGVLGRARMLLPWGEAAAATARAIAPGADVVVVRAPVERVAGRPAGDREPVVAAYAANPDKRGLDLLCRAWDLVDVPGARLVVCGIERARAARFLQRRGVALPEGVELPGSLPREAWLDLLGRASAMASASHYEDWGLAPMEALSAGTPLATVASAGPYEALGPARRLAPELVAERREPGALAEAIRSALALGATEREDYERRAGELLDPYRPEAIQRVVAEEVLPRMLA